jgi:hypothetical protein
MTEFFVAVGRSKKFVMPAKAGTHASLPEICRV